MWNKCKSKYFEHIYKPENSTHSVNFSKDMFRKIVLHFREKKRKKKKIRFIEWEWLIENVGKEITLKSNSWRWSWRWISRKGQDIFFNSKGPERLCGAPSPLFSENRRSFPGVKTPGREVDHSSPSSAKVKKECSYTANTSCIQGGSNMTGTVYTCLHTNQSRSYLNHLVYSFFYMSSMLYILIMGVDEIGRVSC